MKRAGRTHYTLTAVIVGVIGITVLAMLFRVTKNDTDSFRDDDTVYRVAEAKYGTLTDGVTGTAPVSVKMARQVFDLDIPAPLQVEEVLVSVGQQIQRGTALIRFTSDSVQDVRTALQRNVLETSRECELLETRQEELRLQASQGHDSAVVDGKYAGVVYDGKCDELQKRADDAKEAVDSRQDQVNENLLELTRLQQELAEAQKYLRDAETAVSENYKERHRNAYYYTVYENTRETAQNMVEQLEGQLEGLAKENEALLYEIDEATRAYHQVVQDLEKERLAAKMERDTEIYGSGMASERYDIQTERLDYALQEARERYQSALHNIREFDAGIVRGRLISGDDGVVADVMAGTGDVVSKNDILVTLWDQEAVTMVVSLEEEDFLAIKRDEAANITFSQYPGKIYEGRITGVSDMECEVTVTIQGDVAGLTEGMSGDVTFPTGRTRQALYVPKAAVHTGDGRSYVKICNDKGKIKEKNVATGISDGIYIEIVKGISRGDVVIVEDKEFQQFH